MLSTALLVLTVRLYTPADMDPHTLTAALHEAETILRHAGVAVTWVECRTGTSAPADCARPVQPHEVIVRFATAADARYVDRPLGEALVDLAGRGGVLATLFVNRLDGLAAAARISPGVLYGRALAHELGHLLLGSNQHRPGGLMSAGWSRQALTGSLAVEWRFSPEDQLELRQQLAARSSLSSARLSSN